MKRAGLLALAAGAAMLSACGDDRDATAPTAEENRQLDNAAEMLDASPDSLTATEGAALGNGEESDAGVAVDEGNAANANAQ